MLPLVPLLSLIFLKELVVHLKSEMRFSLTVTGQSTFDFTHKIVSSVNNSSGVGGFFSTRLTVDHDPHLSLMYSTPLMRLSRRSVKVPVRTLSGTGRVHIQQVQVS